MPISPRFHVRQMLEFALQVERAPENIRRKQMLAAEELLHEIDDESLYPIDYVVYRITAYRSDSANEVILLGSALRGDLVALVARVSRTLQLTDEGMLSVQEVAEQLQISTRTLSRLRSEGFLMYWVVQGNGKKRLGCSSQMIDDFVSRNKDRLTRASAFSRLSEIEQQNIIELAMRYKGEKKTLSEVAAELARTSTRGHETIRVLLQETGRTSKSLPQPSRITRSNARAIEESLQSGASWVDLSSEHNRTPDAMRKAIARLRATRLKQMETTFVDLEVFARVEAEEVILGAPAARSVDPPTLILDSLLFSHSDSEPEEIAVVSAMHLLRRRSAVAISGLKYAPSITVLDRIETDLRWSFLLQQKLIIDAMPAALAVAVQYVGRPLHELPANRLLPLLELVIQVVGKACAEMNPSTGQTAKRTPASVLDRALPMMKALRDPTRAAAKYKEIQIHCPFHGVVPWSNLLPTTNVYENAQENSARIGKMVGLKYGWLGVPMTVLEIADVMGEKPTSISKQLLRWS